MTGRVRAVTGSVFLAAALGFAVWAVISQWDPFWAAVARIGPARVLASTAATGLGLLAGAAAWRCWVSALGVRLPARPALRLFLLTQLGRYIPGGVWPLVAQAAVGRTYGVPAAVFPSATLLFMLAQLSTATTLGGLAVVVAGHPVPGAALTVVGAAVTLLLGLPGLVGPLTRGRFGFATGAARPAWAGHGLLMGSWVCFGVALSLLVQGVGFELPVPAGTVGFAAAWVVGFLAIFAPAGAGVRELVLVWLLQLPTADALAVVLVSRITTIVADLALAGTVAALVRPVPTAASGGAR